MKSMAGGSLLSTCASTVVSQVSVSDLVPYCTGSAGGAVVEEEGEEEEEVRSS